MVQRDGGRLVLAGMLAAMIGAAGPVCAADGLEPLPGDTRPLAYRFTLAPRLDDARFGGRAEIRFEAVRPTRKLVLNALGLDVALAKVDGVAAAISYDAQRQRVAFDLPEALGVGPHTLAVEWTAPITRNVEGVFKVDYKATSGAAAQMLFLHSCCINTGRMFAPMWDEPAAKARFVLDLTVPAGLEAVSNMPAETHTVLADGRTRVVFAPTPPMSSYLLFFAIGAFDRIDQRLGETDLGVVVQQGKAEQGRFALAATRDLLGYYNAYFDQRFPLPKLDSIAFPGAGNFGAMENWGAIFYFEPYILLDPALSTEQDRQRVYSVVAHEVAHQWFGDLVTMRWWDDIWLNEGFASWMEAKATDHFHPDWKMWLHAADSREVAMRLDAQATTHAVVRPLRSIEEAVLGFDEISYEKGSQIIRMIETWVGDEPFRKAIRTHIADHAYGNAESADLWQAIDRASGDTVSTIARTFTDQPGLPLLTLASSRCDPATQTTTAILRQERFGAGATEQTWRIPLIATVVGAPHAARQVISGPGATSITLQGCGAVKLNAGETGYFRARYDAASREALRRVFRRLDPADQIGLVNDSYALAEAGYDEFSAFLDFTDQIDGDADPVVQLRAVTLAGALDALVDGLAVQPALRARIQSRFGARLQALGWAGGSQEAANVGLLRNALIDLLARTGDPLVIAQARRRFATAASDPAAPPPEVRAAVLRAVGAGADDAMFDVLARRAADARDGAEQRLYLLALANANDPAVARRALQLSLTDAVPAQFFSRFVGTIARRHPDVAVDFAITHFDAIAPKLDSIEQAGFVPGLAETGDQPELAARLREFAAQRIGRAGDERVERAVAAILHRNEVRQTRLGGVAVWLRRHGDGLRRQ